MQLKALRADKDERDLGYDRIFVLPRGGDTSVSNVPKLTRASMTRPPRNVCILSLPGVVIL